MSAVEQTAEETFDSLTGFDEIAIAQRFGRSVGDLATSDPSMFGRALVFVIKRRDGANDEEAWNAAMGLSMKGFTEFFAEPSEEEAGKDKGPEQQPGTSLSSVS
jgi:hypothetical protein